MKRKQWSILFYLNGNNEMAPEMQKSLEALKNNTIDKEKNIVIEIGQAPEKLVKKLRTSEKINYKTKWNGVRRYFIENNSAKLVGDLANINMADYKNLYKFMEWGIKNYPAKRYMVVIAGHGFTVLTLSDFCAEMPYTMGMYEMALAVNSIKKNLKVQIDILNFDICNMNNIEVIYELGKYTENTSKYVLTYIKDGPLEGMNYNKMINSLNDEDTQHILKDIVTNSENELLAVKVDSRRLKNIKELTSKLGYEQLSQKKNKKEDSLNIQKYLRFIATEVEKVIIAYKFINEPKPLLNIIDDKRYKVENLSAFLRVYNKLEFSKNNYWSNVVAQKTIDDEINHIMPKVRQEVLTKDNVNSIIRLFNRCLEEKEILKITNEVYEMQKWNIKI